MGAVPGDAGNRITRVTPASAKLTLWASGYAPSGAEVPGHLRAQARGVARSVSDKHPARVRVNGRTCVVGLKCLHTWYNGLIDE
jgi:hypothetical protein